MREDDDSARSDAAGDPADGLGGATGAGGYSSSEPFGDASFEDSYGDDSYGDDSYGDDSYGDDSYGDDAYGDDSYGGGADDGDTSTLPADDAGDGGYGDGDGDGEVVDDEDAEAAGAGGGLDDSDLLAQQSSPLEGLGYLIDEVRDALFGDDDGDAAAAEPADDSGEGAFDADGLLGVDPATDLDADVDGPAADGGDHGVIDA